MTWVLFETFEEALAQMERCPPGPDYVITAHGKIIWPESRASKYN
jgi:hypothetical protein